MQIETYFKGLADRNRLRIINLLGGGELCGCDIMYVLRSSQSNTSRHLTYLKNSGLVHARRSGYRVYYQLNSSKANASLFAFLRRAFQSDEVFKKDRRHLRRAVAQGACKVSQSSRPARSSSGR